MYDFFVCLLCFIAVPALIGIYANLREISRASDVDYAKTPYLVWLLTNQVGVVLLPLFAFVVLSINQFGLTMDIFTKPGISGNVVITVVFSGILAIANSYYKLEQENTRMSIVKQLGKELAEKNEAILARFKEEQRQDQQLAEARLRDQQREAEERRQQERQELLDLYRELGKDVEQLKLRWAKQDQV